LRIFPFSFAPNSSSLKEEENISGLPIQSETSGKKNNNVALCRLTIPEVKQHIELLLSPVLSADSQHEIRCNLQSLKHVYTSMH
jgi:hypothetical protein